MTLSEFRRLLEIWGSDPQRWPTGDRERAIALLGDSPEARQLNDEARKLDRALDALPLPIDVQASARWLKGAVLARAARLPEKTGLRDWLGLYWARTGAFVAVAAVAILLGWVISEPGDPHSSSDDVASLLMRDTSGVGP